ncbi:AfsR/SARP family transcriptional regulator [Pseudactinotalea sp. Z1748]|uniref:AfsR/SARP family transcriptional regulator n=1 Tax=Pseudactinotalea sp. Z1748 TaxID=3413027 RepID=UPI003C7CA44A
MSVLAAHSCAGAPLVHLIGHPRVSRNDAEIRLVDSGMRLLAFVSLHRGMIDRHLAAAELWPDADDVHAAGNLRTALWRVNAVGVHLVDATRTSLRLATDVQVDAHLLGAWAARIISGTVSPHDLAYPSWDVERLELLPGWYDEWLLLDRERLRQRLLHGLEEMCRRLIGAGRCAEAVDVGVVAAQADPLRESAQEVLIQAHLAVGNRAQALRAFEAHRLLLRRELGVEPAPRLRDLLALGKVGPRVERPAALVPSAVVR